ncbi:MAG: DUF1552 domain-containing protein [Polyangiaceae bacterium]
MRRSPTRRNFLRSAAGLCVALPMLEMTHGKLWAAEGKAKRLVVFFSHGGTITRRSRTGTLDDQYAPGAWHPYDLWKPGDEGVNLTTLGEEMAPLDAVKGDLILLRGVDDSAGSAQGDYGGKHGCSNVTSLTCADTTDGGDDAEALGPSIDQFVAQRLAEESPTPFSSIDLMVDGHNYGEPLYRASGERISSERNPGPAFDRLFKDVTETDSGPTPEQLRIRAYKQSVLDGVLEQLNAMRARVGKADAYRLEAHADHIRALEKQLEALDNLASCTKPDVTNAPFSEGYGNYDDGGMQDIVGPMHVDILLAAFRCGLSNVATYQIGDLLTDWLPSPYNTDLGHSLGHAGLAVGQDGAESDRLQDWRATIVANRNWRMDLFGKVIQGLKDTPEGDGNMLDNSILLFTSEFSCGGDHSPIDMPCLLAGRAGGKWTTGKHYNFNKAAKSDPSQFDYDTDTSLHNVYTSILHGFGWDDAHFGNDNCYKQGPVSELG